MKLIMMVTSMFVMIFKISDAFGKIYFEFLAGNLIWHDR